MKTTIRLLAIVILLAVTSWQNTMPTHGAYPNPMFDITGVWKNPSNETMQIFQEKDLVNATFVNGSFAHRLAGRYYTQQKIKMILIRRTRAGGCEMTMEATLTVTSANAFSLDAVALETACGLTAGQSYPNLWTRVL